MSVSPRVSVTGSIPFGLNVRSPIEKTRRAHAPGGPFRLAVWDWLEAVHSWWPQRINSTAFRVMRGFRAEALRLSHLTWDTTMTIRFHIFGSPSFPVCGESITPRTLRQIILRLQIRDASRGSTATSLGSRAALNRGICLFPQPEPLQ